VRKQLRFDVKYSADVIAAPEQVCCVDGGRADRLGGLVPGRYEDLIAVGGDPLADMRQLEQVQFVMKGSVIYRRDDQALQVIR